MFAVGCSPEPDRSQLDALRSLTGHGWVLLLDMQYTVEEQETERERERERDREREREREREIQNPRERERERERSRDNLR